MSSTKTCNEPEGADAGIGQTPQRSSQTWATFLRYQAEAILAADFLETVA